MKKKNEMYHYIKSWKEKNHLDSREEIHWKVQ